MSTKHHTVSPATQIFNPQVERAIPASTSQLHSITAILLVFSSHPTGGRRLSWPGLPVTHFPGQLLSGCVRWLVRYLHVAGWCQLGSYLLQLSLSSLTKWPLMEGMSQPLCRLSIAQVEIWPLTCITHTHTHTHTHTTILRLSGLCPGQPGWANTRKYISPSSGFSGAKWR